MRARASAVAAGSDSSPAWARTNKVHEPSSAGNRVGQRGGADRGRHADQQLIGDLSSVGSDDVQRDDVAAGPANDGGQLTQPTRLVLALDVHAPHHHRGPPPRVGPILTSTRRQRVAVS